jgi:transposase
LDAQRRIAELEATLVAKDARIAELEQQVAKLTEQVKLLMEQFGQNSSNSSKPPSSDKPGSGVGADKKRKKKSKRKRGGQHGHKGKHRELLPPDQVDEFVDLFPERCENCWDRLLAVADPRATRFQVTEVPPIEPHTTEYRRHAVTCSCGHTTQASTDGIPASPFGPRLMAIIGLLSGVYHVSRRKTVTLLSDLLGVRISLGGVSGVEARVSDAVEAPVEEAWDKAKGAKVKFTDGTSWLQAGVALSLWTIATAMVTVFKVVTDGSKKTLRPLYGSLKGILVSDRATALNFWAMERRQICWAHLIRKFVSFSERDGPAGDVGRDLLNYAGLVFEYWHAYRDGALTRNTFLAWIAPVRVQFEATLEGAVAADIKRLSGSCANMLEYRQALWTFIDTDGVEPTNNHAERELRAFVLWRRRSFGTQSERGNLFAERIMTVAHTARKQNLHVLSFLTECCHAYCAGAPAPSLFATAPQRAAA